MRKAAVQESHNKAQVLAAQTSALWLVIAFTSDCLLSQYLAAEALYPPCRPLFSFLYSLFFVPLGFLYQARNSSLSFHGFGANQQRPLSTVVAVLGKILVSLWRP